MIGVIDAVLRARRPHRQAAAEAKSITKRERRVLDAIDNDLADSAPELALLLATFTLATAGQDMPACETIRADADTPPAGITTVPGSGRASACSAWAADRQVAGRRNGQVGNGSSAVPAGTGRPCTCCGSSSPLRYQAYWQALFATESITQALRQLEVYGHEGLPVPSADGHQIPGWVTAPDMLTTIGRQITTEQARTARAQPAPTTVTPAGIEPAAPVPTATRIPRSLRSPSPLTRLPPGRRPRHGPRRPRKPSAEPRRRPNPIMAENITCASLRYPPPCVANEPAIYKRASRSPQ